MSSTTDQILEQLKTLTLLEASELVKDIQETFGIESLSYAAAPGAAPAAAGAAAGGEATEEKTDFDVVLEGVPNSTDRIKVIKVVRNLTSLGLKEAKALIEDAPKSIKEGVSKADAEEAQKQLEEAGGKVTLK